MKCRLGRFNQRQHWRRSDRVREGELEGIELSALDKFACKAAPIELRRVRFTESFWVNCDKFPRQMCSPNVSPEKKNQRSTRRTQHAGSRPESPFQGARLILIWNQLNLVHIKLRMYIRYVVELVFHTLRSVCRVPQPGPDRIVGKIIRRSTLVCRSLFQAVYLPE